MSIISVDEEKEGFDRVFYETCIAVD